MALTLEQAKTRLINIATGDTEALKNLINDLSIEASGNKTFILNQGNKRFKMNSFSFKEA